MNAVPLCSQDLKRPRFAVASAAYNVARYLDDFISALERQTFDLRQLEVVIVDDGSTDETFQVLRDWRERQPDLVTVLTQSNSGQASARNAALEHVTADWVTFLDPDDWVDDGYFQTVSNFIDDHPDVQLVGTYRLFYDERPDGSGSLRDGHPLRHLFRGEDKAVDLNAYPNFFHGSAPSAFLRRDPIEDSGLRFDTRVWPNFEDGHFCAQYLLKFDRPIIGLLSSAKYYYRKRSDLSSTLQNSLMQSRRFTDVPRFGYLALLRDATDEFGRAPTWVQNMILYELSWYFSSDESPTAAATAATGAIGREFVKILREIVTYIDDSVINAHDIRKYKQVWRDVLLYAMQEQQWHTPYVVLYGYDRRQREVRLAFHYVGDCPSERYFVRGVPVDPLHQKIRTVEYFGTVVMYERIVWVRQDGTLRVQLNGHDVELRNNWFDSGICTSLRPSQLRARFGIRDRAPLGRRRKYLGAPRRFAGSVRRRLRRVRAHFSIYRMAEWTLARRYRGAWVIMDRIHDCNDSGEILFRHLLERRPDVRAFFVLKEGTQDWRRLSQIVPRSRLIKYGSRRWTVLMLSCDIVISSHVDAPIHHPRHIVRQRSEKWKFAFLQHGVIKDDLSRWLNPKDLDLFVTSTRDEYRSIAGDMTPYIYTSKEVCLTGLPRFDALQAAAVRVAHCPKNLVIVAPTWRQWLNQLGSDGSPRSDAVDQFVTSEFAKEWLSVVTSERLMAAAMKAEMTVALLPHPNITPAIPALDLPASIEILDYTSFRLHEYFASAAVLITDYSSMAFNAAYLDRPVVYFQFDRDKIARGGHLGRAGYFDYEDDGFGPVVSEADAAVDALLSVISEGGRSEEMYRDRAHQAFVHRDGKCTERVVGEIERIL